MRTHFRVDRPGNADVWGNTPLHHAAASHRGAKAVSVLLRHGANPNAVGAYGATPLAAALWDRHGRSAHFLQKVGASAACGPFNEASQRGLLACLFGLRRHSDVDQQPIDLMRSHEIGSYPFLGRLWDLFCAELDAELLATNIRTLISQALHRAVHRGMHGQQTDGVPFILPGGWSGHSIAYVGWKHQLVRVDRFRRRRGGPWWSMHIASPWAMAAMEQVLRRVRTMPAQRGRFILGSCERALGSRAATLQLQANCFMKPGGADNCVLANGKAAVYTLLILAGAPQPHRVYKLFTTFARAQALREYLTRHESLQTTPIDQGLVSACRAKLAAASRRAWLRPTWLLPERPSTAPEDATENR